MRYRSVLNHCWGAVSLLWIAWCLCWPFYTRRQDIHAIRTETNESYQLCLQQKGMTPEGCATDRWAYTDLDTRISWPPGQSAYQSFSGERPADAISFFIVLCLLPVVSGYALVRGVLEVFLWFARARPQDARACH